MSELDWVVQVGVLFADGTYVVVERPATGYFKINVKPRVESQVRKEYPGAKYVVALEATEC